MAVRTPALKQPPVRAKAAAKSAAPALAARTHLPKEEPPVEDDELIGEDDAEVQEQDIQQARRESSIRNARQPQRGQSGPPPVRMEGDLAFASGLFRGKGKMLFQVTCEAERLIQAVQAALQGSADPQKVKIKILENISGKADAWLAFSPLSEEPPQRGGQGYGGPRGGRGNSYGGNSRGNYGGGNRGGRYQQDSWDRSPGRSNDY